ncbi:MAG: acyl-CoA dehydrogenase family protein [Nocardioides sp.]|uniref:acyl-CoA dehydrogenase family protein n=1 Tax=Nocardioides sp. TaxID=35761 RepID=UPI0039E6A2A3
MKAAVNAEREALRATAAEFVRREVAPHLQEWEDAGSIPRDLHRAAADQGLLGVAFPETAVEAAAYVTDRAVQLHGGTGYLHGIEVERHYRDARILPIGGGATEVLSDLAARLMGYAS